MDLKRNKQGEFSRKHKPLCKRAKRILIGVMIACFSTAAGGSWAESEGIFNNTLHVVNVAEASEIVIMGGGNRVLDEIGRYRALRHHDSQDGHFQDHDMANHAAGKDGNSLLHMHRTHPLHLLPRSIAFTQLSAGITTARSVRASCLPRSGDNCALRHRANSRCCRSRWRACSRLSAFAGTVGCNSAYRDAASGISRLRRSADSSSSLSMKRASSLADRRRLG
jgi:hypothetical protein